MSFLAGFCNLEPPQLQQQQPSKFVPFEVLVTGRTISTSFHRVQPYKNDGKDPQKAHTWRKLKLRSFRRNTFADYTDTDTDTDSKPKAARLRGGVAGPPGGGGGYEGPSTDLGYDASEEGSVDEGVGHTVITTVQPLMFSSLVQPHFFVTCSPLDQKIEMSVYDLTLSLAGSNHCITCSGGRCLPTEQDFTRPIVQTRPGEPGRLSGIPPALFTLAVSSFLEHKDPIVHVKFERPLKLNVSPELMQSLTESCNSIVSAYAHEDIIKLISPATGNGVGSSPPSKKNLRRRISSLALTTSQVHN